MNKQTSKIITESQECYKLKQETLRDNVWMGDTILLMSFFDKYFNSLFLNDDGVQLWDNLWEEPSRHGRELVQRPRGENALRILKDQKEDQWCSKVTLCRNGRRQETREIRQSWVDESYLGFIPYEWVRGGWKVLSSLLSLSVPPISINNQIYFCPNQNLTKQNLYILVYATGNYDESFYHTLVLQRTQLWIPVQITQYSLLSEVLFIIGKIEKQP